MSKLDKLRTLIPMEEIEQEAQKQIYDALDLDFLIRLVIMPDAHCGYSLPIGGIALLEKVISPAYIGYDINCGMCRVITNLLFSEVIKDLEEALKIREKIINRVPCGVGRTSNTNFDSFKSATGDKNFTKEVNDKLNQLGTLGSGNHFIEIGKNLKDNLCIIIHTGSRKPGWLIGHYYMNLSKRADMDLPRDFLHLHGEAGQQYLQDMKYAEDFAHNNRREIMSNILDVLGLSKSLDMINITHNHAVLMGDNVLHRKGATPAEKNQIGIIPGSMQTGTYVTIGLGNEEYLNSSSHGAGRKLSRRKAKESIDIEAVKIQMNGIVCDINNAMLEEAPDAYKDLSTVVKLQEGIVIDTIDYIKPIINIKG